MIASSRWAARACAAVAFSLASLAAPAFAATAVHSILLDTDADQATGCPVTTVRGTVAGVEQVLETTITTTTTSATVTGVARRVCAGGTLGAPQSLGPAGWPVGMGNGTGGAAVIETGMPRSLLPASGTLRIAAMSTTTDGGDAILPAPGGGTVVVPGAPPPPTVGNVEQIPVLHPLLIALLAALLGGLGLRFQRSRAAMHVSVLFLAGVLVALVAHAANVLKDGQVGDWAGVAPLATDAAGNAPPNADQVALFAQFGDSELFFRIDAVVVPDTAPGANVAPTVDAGIDQSITLPANASLAGSATDDGLPNPPGALSYAWSVTSGPAIVSFADPSAPATTASFTAAGVYVLRLTANDSLLSAFDEVQITVSPAPGGTTLPPDPSTVAPLRNPSIIEPFESTIAFLWQGNPPIQTGVVPGTIQPVRAAVIRGKVMDRTGAPMPGARISILRHSEFGQTLSRADGHFDLAVNGGGKLIVRYEKAGHFEAQRDVIVPWQDFVHAPDVVLTPPDSAASPVDLASPLPQVARANPVTDSSGSRRATLITLPGTTAQFRMPNGSLQPAPSRLTVRQTEYTVGALGPASMPSELPPTSGYTYYLELTADEELAVGAIGVEFNQPVVFYLENFIGFAVGSHAPVGFYDRQNGVWKGEPDGRVVKVISIIAGAADLDTDGDGSADNGIGTGENGGDLGISLAERQTIAGLYAAGQTLWRVQTTHFSPGDINWPYGPPPDAVPPDGGDPDNDDRRKSPCDCPPCKAGGSIIECGNQTLGESIPIVGTGMSLNYRSDRVPGRLAANRLDIPITGATVPASLEAATLEVNVAGQRHTQRFGNATAQRTSFGWDGKDAYGRAVQGQQTARVRVGFEYEAVFQATPQDYYRSWALANGNPTSLTARNRAVLYRDFDLRIGAWDARGQGLGGWSLSEHHVYDHLARQLYLGTGERRRDIDGLAPVVSTIAGNGSTGAPIEGGRATASPMTVRGALATEPDGSVLFKTVNAGTRLHRLKPDGTFQRIAGSLTSGAPLFGASALDSTLAFSDRFATGPDGSIYITHPNRGIVTRIRPGDQFVEVFAGTLDQLGFAGDGGPATAARLNQPRDIAVGSDGSVYLHDAANRRIRRIGPDGFIATVAGNGDTCGGLLPDPQCDEGPALGQKIGSATSHNHLAIAPDGAIWAIRPAGTFAPLTELYRIGIDGVLRVIAGKRDVTPGSPQSTAEGIPARNANVRDLVGIAFDREGLVHFGLPYGIGFNRTEIRFIDRTGNIRVLAGSSTGFGGDGGPARSARFNGLASVAFNPAGELVVIDSANNRIRRLQSRFPGFAGTADILLPAQDGSVVYRFDPNGRHLQTLHGLTGAALLSFGYDGAGRLTTVTDGNNNITTIQRNGTGAPTAIVAPFGQVTQLATDANGWLTQITNPANETVGLTHQANGLLTGMTTPKGQSYTFAYDAATGHLQNDADPAGGHQALARTDLAPDATRLAGHDVAKTTTRGRTTGYRTERLRNGDRVETATASDGNQTVMLSKPSGEWSVADATSSTGSGLRGADPRFGMLAPVTSSRSIRVPSGQTLNATGSMTATLSDPADIFSIATLDLTATLNGRTFSASYAGAGRQFTTTSAGGRSSSGTIDMLGRLTAEQFGGLAPASMTYDARGRLASMTVGSGAEARTTTFQYNAEGHVRAMTDPLGQITSFTYDAAGRPVTQTTADGRVITVAYDANGNVVSIAPPSRPPHAFAYSAVDLQTQYDPPDVAGISPDVTGVSYNTDQEPTQVARSDGRAITAAYDAAGRVSSLAFSRGSLNLSYEPSTGRLSGAGAPDGIGHAFAYDGRLLTAHTMSGTVSGVVSWTWDNDFRPASQSVNGAHTVLFAYDPDSLLIQAGALVLNRNAQNGLLTGTTLGVVTDAWTYNSHAEPTDYQVMVSGSPVYRSQFVRDALGRITQKSESINGTTDTYVYSYDLSGRLVGASRNAVPVSYGYDGNSNRLSYTGPLGNVAGAVYDAQDRLIQYGTTTYTYDNHGDLATRTEGGASTQYSYDEFGNLTHVVLAGGTQIDYLIDAMNRRVGKKVDGTLTRRWLYEGLRIVAELDGAGALISRFVYADSVNVPEYVVRGSTTYRLITDYTGSPRLLIDTTTGAIAGTMNHDEYGRVTQDTLSALIPFGFAGGHYDSHTGLVRFGARDYDTHTGRWTSKDPIGLVADVNLYAYVGADPINFFDPEGLDDRVIVVRREGTIVTFETGSNQPINVMTNRYMTEGRVRVAPWSTVKIGLLDGGSILIRADCEEIEVDVADTARWIRSQDSWFGPSKFTVTKTGRVDPTPPLKWIETPLGDRGWVGRDPTDPRRYINQLPYRVRTNSAVLSVRG